MTDAHRRECTRAPLCRPRAAARSARPHHAAGGRRARWSRSPIRSPEPAHPGRQAAGSGRRFGRRRGQRLRPPVSRPGRRWTWCLRSGCTSRSSSSATLLSRRRPADRRPGGPGLGLAVAAAAPAGGRRVGAEGRQLGVGPPARRPGRAERGRARREPGGAGAPSVRRPAGVPDRAAGSARSTSARQRPTSSSCWPLSRRSRALPGGRSASPCSSRSTWARTRRRTDSTVRSRSGPQWRTESVRVPAAPVGLPVRPAGRRGAGSCARP